MPIPFKQRVAAAALVAVSLAFAGTASATVIGSQTDTDFSGASFTFGYLGQTFTLTDNGSGFPNAVSASTSGTAMYAKDFFGISVFFDPPRNTLVFDSSYQYASYPSATVLAYSSQPTIIGLAVTANDGVHYGYAQFAGTTLDSYAFESQAGVGIAALAPIVAAIPEPSALALSGVGLLALALGRRKRRQA